MHLMQLVIYIKTWLIGIQMTVGSCEKYIFFYSINNPVLFANKVLIHYFLKSVFFKQ